MLEEPRILRGQDRLAEVLRNVVVVDDDAALDRELANELTILPEHARDGVGRIAVERADFGKVVGIGEQHPAQRAQECSTNKKGRDAGMTSVTNGDLHEMELRAVALAKAGVNLQYTNRLDALSSRPPGLEC